MIPLLRYGIIEDIHTVRRIRIGRIWGVDVFVTALKWLGPFIFFGFHFLLNLLNTGLELNERLYLALVFIIALELTTTCHAFGHILSGKLVNSAMDELLITTIRDVNLYHGDQRLVPGYVQLARALGGPVLNLIVAGICLMIAPSVNRGFLSDLISSLIATNLFFGIGSFFPVPTVDGEVIWREILRSSRKA